MSTEVIKKISISYSDMEELLNREPFMMQTLNNYLKRNKEYEFHQSYITQDETKVRLNIEIKLKDGYNERTDY